MADQNQMRPSSPQQAPDPSTNFDRSHPEHESGMGRLDNNSKATPTDQPDQMGDAVGNVQDSAHQLNAHEVVSERAVEDPVDSAIPGAREGGEPLK